MGRNDRTRVAGLLIFFKASGYAKKDRREALALGDDRILAITRVLHCADMAERALVHEILSYVNTHPRASGDVTKDDLTELRKLLDVSDVMDS